jgi:hypothetical protein
MGKMDLPGIDAEKLRKLFGVWDQRGFGECIDRFDQL